jgi:hypothetical protein
LKAGTTIVTPRLEIPSGLAPARRRRALVADRGWDGEGSMGDSSA